MKSTLILFSLLLTLSLFAQSSKNNWYLAGSSGIGYEREVSGRAFSVSSLYAHSFRTGYLIKDRFLIGSNISFSSFSIGGGPVRNVLQLQPFTRYYFSGNVPRKVRYFGEVGFGTFSFFDVTDDFETDFHLAAGAEISLRPGILGTLDLRYNANALGLNFTNLTMGFNVLLGQLEHSGAAAVSLTQGTLMTRANVGFVRIGGMRTNGLIDQRVSISLSPWLGFFVSDQLMLEGNLGLYHTSTRNEINGLNIGERRSSSNTVRTSLNLRYYLKRDGKLLPYLVAGGGFIFRRNLFRTDNTEDKRTRQSLAFNLGAGASYFFSPNLALETQVVYDRNKQLNQLLAGNNSLSGSANLYMNIGFRFFLPKD